MSGSKLALALVGFLLLSGAAVPAWAIPITLAFTVDFSVGPYSAISGSFDYDADSVTSNTITALNSVSLTIDGYTYSVGELGTGTGVIGTTANALGNVEVLTHDFALVFDAPGDTIYLCYS